MGQSREPEGVPGALVIRRSREARVGNGWAGTARCSLGSFPSAAVLSSRAQGLAFRASFCLAASASSWPQSQ